MNNHSPYDEMSPEHPNYNILSAIKHLIETDQAHVLQGALEMYPILVDRRDLNERTWLHMAAESGTWSCVDVLLKMGLEIDAQDVMGETPLHRAATRQYKDTARVLLENGANPNIKNAHGVTPLLLVAGYSNDLFQDMISHGADPDVRDKFNNGIEEWAGRAVRLSAQSAQVEQIKKSKKLTSA